jgi:regulator of RNase E activity RraA
MSMTMDYTTSREYADGPTNIDFGEAWQRPEGDLLEAFGSCPAANVGDALGRLGMPDGGLAPIWDGCCAVGSALTVLTVAGDDLAVIEAVARTEPGDFLVINGFGYQGRAVMGDILARLFLSRGAVGAIVDGAVRDRDEIRRLGFPVWSRALTPAGPWKNGPGAVGTPVAVGGVVINPGDIVVADSDGIAVVPRRRAHDIAADLTQVAEAESQMRRSAGGSGG